MKKGDDNQQKDPLEPDEISEDFATTLWLNDMPNYTSVVSSSTNGSNYSDIIKVLSQVELPSPSPMLATSSSTLVSEDNLISFDEGQPSGINKVDEIEEIIKGQVEQERELKVKHEYNQEPRTQRLAPETHRGRHVSRIHERIRALKALIPNCTKRDQASILDDAIYYIKFLQMQVQMMQYMGVGVMPQALYMPPTMHSRTQGPYLAPYFPMRPMIGGYNPGQYLEPYFNSSLQHISPPFFTGLSASAPPMEVGIGTPRLLPVPHGSPSQASQPFSYHMPVTTDQETQQVSTSSGPNFSVTGAQMNTDSNDDQIS